MSYATAMEHLPIDLYTDGSSSGNPGPGGYGVVLQCGELRKEMSGGFALTTNNRMEILAVIVGLEAVKWDNAEVHIHSDSSYVVRAVTDGWIEKWERNGFIGSNRKPVKNVDLWTRFTELYRRHRVTFHWLKGHAGHPENELCDRLAVAAGSAAFESGAVLPHDVGYEEYAASKAASSTSSTNSSETLF